MAVPSTYSEWSCLLDKFANGDNTALEDLSEGYFIVDAGTALRFYSRVEDVYKKRKQDWLDRFDRSFQLQNFKSENDFEIILRNGKQNLSPLSKFVALKGLPEDLKLALKKDLDDFVAEIKKSLKDNVSKISNGREKVLILLSTFGLNDVSIENKAKEKSNEQNTNEIITPTGRKIIF